MDDPYFNEAANYPRSFWYVVSALLPFCYHINMITAFKAPSVQVSLVILGYVPLFWTSNPEFEDKKSIID